MEHPTHRGTDAAEPERPNIRQRPDGKTDPAGEAGWFLQYERERRGESLAEAAARTKIRATFLHALEQGALDQLPGWPYLIGFVRNYARHLDLEPDPLAEHYQRFVRKPAAIDRLGGRSRWLRRSTTLRAITALIGVTAVSGMVVWAEFADGVAPPIVTAGWPALFSNDPPNPVEGGHEAAVPVRAVAADRTPGSPSGAVPSVVTGSVAPERPVPTPTPSPGREADKERARLLGTAVPTVQIIDRTMSAPSSTAAAPEGRAVVQSDVETLVALDGTVASGGAAGPGGDPGAGDAPDGREMTALIVAQLGQDANDGDASGGTEAALPSAEGQQRSAAAGREASEPSAKDRAAAGGVVTLRARERVWVRIEDDLGYILLSQTMEQGETYKVPQRNGLKLVVRDAGALEMSVDGGPFKALGRRGEVLDHHRLTPAAVPQLDG